MKKNILLCLEQLDIGGVETFVYNQAIVLKEKGYNVYVLARKGKYKKKLKKLGVKVINFTFPLLTNINIKDTEKIIKIINKYNITEVHINQYPCILSVLPACFKCNIPYVAYVHSILFDVFDWFCKTFPIYKKLFPLYFSNAYKIITITNNTKNAHMKKFNIEESKYKILNNSLNFDIFKSTKQVTELQKFLIIGRFSEDKLKTIMQSIDFFKLYIEQSRKEAQLLFLGDGILKDKIKNYLIQNNINNYQFLGSTDNVVPYINEVDVVMGVDRCILEAIGMKKIAVISGYTGFKGLVTSKNIAIAAEENFSGNNLENSSYKTVLENLLKIKKNILRTVQDNYEYIKKNLDIKNNIFTIDEDVKIKYDQLYQKLIDISKNFEN